MIRGLLAASGGPAEPGALQSWASVGRAALISGSFSAAGDAVAQLLVCRHLKSKGQEAPPFHMERALCMLGFGALLYGPFQHWWYGALARRFPGATTRSFLAKVTLNQVVLGPLVLCTAFTWNLGLQGHIAQVPGKIRRDLVGSQVNGWKFWVPAASVNFYAVPLQFQVLFMSACSIAWTAYISFATYNSANAIMYEARKG
jgi:protein Mpv17